MQNAAAPYAELTPDCVLDALDSIGLRGDGRLLALNSYENRVYQIGIEEAPPVVAKFYRPGRWTDAQIAEEHAFVRELAEREIPVVAPLEREGRTLHRAAGFRFAIYPRQGGRAPELEDRDTLEWMGRFLGRIHAVGALAPFTHRPVLDSDTFGREPRDWLLDGDFLPPDLVAAYGSVSAQALALDGVRRCFARAGDVRAAPARRLPRRQRPVDRGRDRGRAAFRRLRRLPHGPAMQDLWMLLSGERAPKWRASSARF